MSDSTQKKLVDQASVLLMHADAALARSVQLAVMLGELARLLMETADRYDANLALRSTQRRDERRRATET